MKRKISNKAKVIVNESGEKLLTRKQAIRKSGYMALSAATMLLLLETNASGQTTSPIPPPAPTDKNTNNRETGIWDD